MSRLVPRRGARAARSLALPLSLAALALAAVALAALAFASAARAQDAVIVPPDAEVDPSTAEARALFETGRELTASRRFSEAADAFARSLALAPRPSTRFNLAVTQYTLGRYVDAIATLESYLGETSDTDPAETEARADAQRMLTHAQRSVARVELELMPTSATVTVDGAPLAGGATRALHVDEGTHVVRVEAEGHVAALFELSVGAGEQVRRAVRLASGQVPGRLAVLVPSYPDAAIRVDGREVGVGTAELTLGAGPHTVRVTHPATEPLERTLELAWDERFELVLAPSARGRSLAEEPALWATVIGLAVLAAGAVIVGVLATQEPIPHGGTTRVVLPTVGNAAPGLAP